MKKWIIVFLLMAVVVAVGYAKTIQERYRDLAFRADSIEAAADTARLIVADSVSRIYQQRIVQTEIERDSLDRLLDERPVVRVPVDLRVDTLVFRDTIPFPVVDTMWVSDTVAGGVETYAVDAADGPFTIAGSFRRLMPGPRGVFDLSVAMRDPANIGVRVTCDDRDGVNAASVALSAEPPFTIIPRKPILADPDVCNRPTVGFRLIPEISVRGIGWELLKGAVWIGLWEYVLDAGEDDTTTWKEYPRE